MLDFGKHKQNIYHLETLPHPLTYERDYFLRLYLNLDMKRNKLILVYAELFIYTNESLAGNISSLPVRTILFWSIIFYFSSTLFKLLACMFHA